MPLADVSPNIQEAQSPLRKRTHDGCAQMECVELLGLEGQVGRVPGAPDGDNKENGWLSTPKNLVPSTAESSPASLTPSGSSPADRKSVSPNPTPTQNPSPTSPAAPQRHITHEPVAIAGSPLSRTKQSTLDAFAHSAKRKREDEEDASASLPKPLLQVSVTSADSGIPTIAGPTHVNSPPAQQPAKKKRSSEEAIQARKAEMEARKAELEAKRQQEKEKKEAEKARAEAEKAALKAKAEAEKAAQKAKADAEKEAAKQAKAEERERKKREKEEEDARKAEEKAKKARAQPTLASFFKLKPTAPKESNADDAGHTAADGTPKKAEAKEVSVYEQMFKPFFVKEQVTLAPLFQMDETTRDTKTRIFEEYITGRRGAVEVKPFDPVQALQLPYLLPRGRLYPSVRSIMAESTDNSSRKPIDLTTESQNTQIRRMRQALQDVPMKFLGFKEDVRPPYYGTITAMPSTLAGLRKLARSPIVKNVLPLQYDYDSEAEWQEEDGEDVDLMDDEEDDAENDEDMGDFLDDSEDVNLTRPLLISGLEPESTGMCWENHERLGHLPRMYKFRMEFILDTLEHHSCIDPFSTKYWDPVPSASTHLAPPSGTSTKSDGKNKAPPPPSDAFKALGATAATAPAKKTAALQADMVEKLKVMIVEKRGLSKVGIVELFSLENNKVSKAAIKNTLEQIAEKSGKEWVLKAGV